MNSDNNNLLVVSDLHLSATDPSGQGSRAVLGLGRLLSRRTAQTGARPTLVLNGDFVDLNQPVGLKGRRFPAAVSRLEQVLTQHPEVLTVLAEHLLAGGRLVVVPGNHDMEFQQRDVREAFLEALKTACGGELSPETVHFSPGPYAEPGRFYIDHGHQFDPDNRVEYLAPKTNGAEAEPTLIPPLGVLISRHLLARLPDEAFHEDGEKTPFWLLIKALARGPLVGPRLIITFYRAALRIMITSIRRRWFAGRSNEQNEPGRPVNLGRGYLLGSELWAQSIMRRPFLIFRRLYLDRSLLFVTGLALFGWLLFVLPLPLIQRLSVCGLTVLGIAAGVVYMPDRYRDRSAALQQTAAHKLATRLGVSCVIFGHSHQEFRQEKAYLNPGRFLRPGEDGKPALHFVAIETDSVGCRAELVSWREAEV